MNDFAAAFRDFGLGILAIGVGMATFVTSFKTYCLLRLAREEHKQHDAVALEIREIVSNGNDKRCDT